MLLNTLFFAEEVTKNPVKEIKNEASEAEIRMAKTIIESMTGKFEPEKYKDEYREKVLAAIEQKISGKEINLPRERSEGKVIDLMDALQKSLLAVKKPAAKKAAPVKKTPPKKNKAL